MAEAEFTAGSVQQADPGPSRVATAYWGADRVPACGPGGLPVAPATGARETLAVEDALALVEELVRGPDAVPALVDTYACRRSRGVTSLLGQRSGPYRVPGDLSPVLSAVGGVRRGAIGKFAGPSAVDGTDEPPESDWR